MCSSIATKSFKRTKIFVWENLEVKILAGAIIVLSLFTLVGAASAQESLKRWETVYVGGAQWGPITSLNPLMPWEIGWGTKGLLYEPLYYYNVITDESIPWLAADLPTWVDNFTVEVTLREGIWWRDGTLNFSLGTQQYSYSFPRMPLTAEDVVYSFEIGSENKYLYCTRFWRVVESMTAIDNLRIQIKLKSEYPNHLFVRSGLGGISIVPKHVWSILENYYSWPPWFANTGDPIGSGPYKLYFLSSLDKIVYERDDNWWGNEYFGQPAPKYVVHKVYPTTEIINRDFLAGDVDWGGQFYDKVWELWETKGLERRAWSNESPYFFPAAHIALIPNLTRSPFDNVAVRRAIAYAINYDRLNEIASSNYLTRASPTFLIDYYPHFAKYIDNELEAQYRFDYNPEIAIEILENAGYTRDQDGIFVGPNNTRLDNWGILVPVGWSDATMQVDLIIQDLRDVGIIAYRDSVDWSVMWNRVAGGVFDMIWWSSGPGISAQSPWDIYYGFFDPRSERSEWRNIENYRNDRVGELLDNIALASDENTLQGLYSELQGIIMEDIPVIPMFYSPGWYLVSEEYWTGWPTAENAYCTPMAWSYESGAIPLLHIRATGARPGAFNPTTALGAFVVITVIVAAAVVIKKRRAED